MNVGIVFRRFLKDLGAVCLKKTSTNLKTPPTNQNNTEHWIVLTGPLQAPSRPPSWLILTRRQGLFTPSNCFLSPYASVLLVRIRSYTDEEHNRAG